MASLSETLNEFSAVIITGGSSGIGKSFIELLGKLKPDILICNLSRRDPVTNLGQLKLRHFPCDLSDQGVLAKVVPQLEAELMGSAPEGKVLLINNSGFGGYGHFPEPDVAHQLEMIDVNVRAVTELTARLLPLLKSRGGAIVTIASTAAFQPTPWMATYGATKAFVLHWSLALNEELRGTGVRTLAVCPGPTKTEFFRRAGLQKGSVADSLSQSCEAVVMGSLKALGEGESQVITGWKNRLLVISSMFAPKPLAARVARIVLARYRLKKAGL